MVGTLSTVITGFVILYPLYVFEILRIPRFLPWPFMMAMASTVVINIAIVAMVALLISHRIAGPLFALVRSMNSIERGSWSAKLRLRQSDELQYVARNFNGMVDGLLKDARQDAGISEQMLSELKSMTAAGKNPDLQKVAKLAEQLHQRSLQRLGHASEHPPEDRQQEANKHD